MKQPQHAGTRVIFNTGILYAKTLITMGISLYSTRLILNALGASDFGIFNLIAGVVVMLSFLNVAMTTSTQRYLSFHQGTCDFEMQKKIFTNSWILHIVIGVIVVVLLLAFSPFLFGGFLNIPIDRISAAKMIYYFMSVSVFFTIVSVPFTASINAHENMIWIAIVNIIESVFKLGIALSLVWFIQTERLTMYGLFMALLSFVIFILYAVICLKKYSECSIRSYQINKPLIKELTTFAGWNLFGTLCGVGKTQGLAVVLNLFFGTVVNAAFGIANQVAAQVNFFSLTMLRAINPQIMKSEGMNDRQRMLRLSLMATKFGFFLLAFIAIPIIFEMPTILKLWLKNVPENTVMFCSLVLVAMLVNQLTIGSYPALQATGKIKIYQSVTGSVLLFTVPLAYILLKLGFPAYYAVISLITMEVIATLFKLYFWKSKAGLSIKKYFEKVILKAMVPVLTAIVICWLITDYLHFEFRFLVTGVISVLFFILSVYFTGLCKDEKLLVREMVFNKILKRPYKNLTSI